MTNDIKVSNTWINMQGYRVLLVDGSKTQYSHYVWWQNTGYWPDWKNKMEIIHHINEDILDDRFENLQLMTQREHMSLHKKEWYETNPHSWLGKKRPEHSERMRGENNPCFGRTGELNPMHGRTGELNPMYGKSGILSPVWKEGPVCYSTQRNRVWRSKKRIAEGCGTDEDIQLCKN